MTRLLFYPLCHCLFQQTISRVMLLIFIQKKKQEIVSIQIQIRKVEMQNSQDNDDRVNGRWTKLEHQQFLTGLELYGKNWKKIQQLIGTRTGSQIRSHAQKYFLKFKKNEFKGLTTQENAQLKTTPKKMAVSFQQSIHDHDTDSADSLFMTILKKIPTDFRNLDFWGEFIDFRQPKKYDKYDEHVENIRRKNSFMALENCYQCKQESGSSCLTNVHPLNI